eukprot:COSAG05_NODE_4778_length_1376_cov_2240.562255_1_plen_95_part_00
MFECVALGNVGASGATQDAEKRIHEEYARKMQDSRVQIRKGLASTTEEEIVDIFNSIDQGNHTRTRTPTPVPCAVPLLCGCLLCQLESLVSKGF